MAAGLERRAEIVDGEVDRLEAERPGERWPLADPGALVGLRSGVIDLGDVDVRKFAHPPRAAVEPGAEDDQLRLRVIADGVIDRHRARHDDLGAGAYRLVCGPGGPALGRHRGLHLIDRQALRGRQQLIGDRVAEAVGRPAVGSCPALADEDRRPAGCALGHRHLRRTA